MVFLVTLYFKLEKLTPELLEVLLFKLEQLRLGQEVMLYLLQVLLQLESVVTCILEEEIH